MVTRQDGGQVMHRLSFPFRLPRFGSALHRCDSCPKTTRLIDSLVYKTQAPADLVMMTALSSYSLSLQGIIDVERPEGGVGPVSLYTLGIADSGERKTTLSRLLLKPHKDFQQRMNEGYEKKLIEFYVDEKIFNKRVQLLEKSILKNIKAGECHAKLKKQLVEIELSRPKPPKKTQMVLEDTTPEALVSELNEGIGNVGLVSDEGASILNGRGAQNLPMLNSAWSSELITVNRKSSASFMVLNPRLTMSIMLQPSAMKKFMAKKGEESIGIGYIARFLVCNPLSNQGERFIGVSFDEEGDGYSEYLSMAEEILAKVKESIDAPEREKKVIKFTLEAKKYRIELCNEIERNLRVGGRFQYSRGHGSKLAENISRIAALLSYIEQGEDEAISLGILKDAEKIAFYYSDVYLRCFEVQPEYIKNAQTLRDYLQAARENGDRYLKKNKIRQSGPASLRNKQVLEEALNTLRGYRELAALLCPNGMVVIDLYPAYPVDEIQWDNFLKKNNLV
ncbi:YfjI family protein [Alkalimarinus sediminis]|uniref:YfjI family protein n=1 Tax=Alkalimarinus sediminis TaxID=1632866 RepID=A0A9E8KIS9_9ALTE|nr:YfjI family protein [Alkalimarinus sediminis]UZW74241.1 YfjI family protein [Alkalimarinus sediminis]